MRLPLLIWLIAFAMSSCTTIKVENKVTWPAMERAAKNIIIHLKVPAKGDAFVQAVKDKNIAELNLTWPEIKKEYEASVERLLKDKAIGEFGAQSMKERSRMFEESLKEVTK